MSSNLKERVNTLVTNSPTYSKIGSADIVVHFMTKLYKVGTQKSPDNALEDIDFWKKTAKAIGIRLEGRYVGRAVTLTYNNGSNSFRLEVETFFEILTLIRRERRSPPREVSDLEWFLYCYLSRSELLKVKSFLTAQCYRHSLIRAENRIGICMMENFYFSLTAPDRVREGLLNLPPESWRKAKDLSFEPENADDLEAFDENTWISKDMDTPVALLDPVKAVKVMLDYASVIKGLPSNKREMTYLLLAFTRFGSELLYEDLISYEVDGVTVQPTGKYAHYFETLNAETLFSEKPSTQHPTIM